MSAVSINGMRPGVRLRIMLTLISLALLAYTVGAPYDHGG
ncbi:hypothetical protein Ga0074812_101178 [Parafrankia irregularis]|uniref:Uncharacterized protein n=1 Tax=Parafrankia irregularis TaxID=795642 RepID=A0A0S4QDG5_9ACTN|nr:hypothetical protein Ga0074812_101178 [Parafrankia irregularis]